MLDGGRVHRLSTTFVPGPDMALTWRQLTGRIPGQMLAPGVTGSAGYPAIKPWGIAFEGKTVESAAPCTSSGFGPARWLLSVLPPFGTAVLPRAWVDNPAPSL